MAGTIATRLCADIGGTSIDLAVVGTGAAIRHRWSVPTPRDWPGFVAAFAQGLAAHPCADVAIATAGLVDPADGTITAANVPAIHGRPLARDLSAALGVAVRAINDADAFVLAEATAGVAQGHARVFGIILGTGVGGGLVEDGRIVSGGGGIGGEWGHGAVLHPVPGHPGMVPVFPCGCGLAGCLDTIGGARGIERLHRFLHGIDATSLAITAGADAGDGAALATVDAWAALLGGPLAMLLNTIAATIVPVGGGLSRAPALIARLDTAVRANMLRPATTPIVVPGALGTDAGIIGAYAAGMVA
ncbi:ROK family protein [Sphingomonas sp. Leaf4]|uniref:ROK family protein n=1 Tax=Sphingomonas sp. Leaf4 TaxID=2876553 RepID=UPI001E353971|nr:ROK family protein [Sphingomonas sp. Leaf4]